MAGLEKGREINVIEHKWKVGVSIWKVRSERLVCQLEESLFYPIGQLFSDYRVSSGPAGKEKLLGFYLFRLPLQIFFMKKKLQNLCYRVMSLLKVFCFVLFTCFLFGE